MVPGMIYALTPIDMEAYNLESPELEAREVIQTEFPTNEQVVGYAITIRDPSLHGSEPGLVYADEIEPYKGDGEGVIEPVGGILNLSVLREINQKAEVARANPISEFYRPILSDVTFNQYLGVITIPDQMRSFMAGESVLTHPTVSPYGIPLPPKTN